MAKKLSFDNLPAAVERILEILTAEGSEHTAVPELLERVGRIEKKVDYLQRTLSPDKPVMEMRDVCRVLKLRPKAVIDLAVSGVLPSREQGRKTVFFEDGVVKHFMTQPAWKEAVASKPASVKRSRAGSSDNESATTDMGGDVPTSTKIAPGETVSDAHRRIDINAASEILGRTSAAVYQLILAKRVPHYKDGRKVYFFADELRQWAASNPPHPRTKK